MLEVGRYYERSPDFGEIIARRKSTSEPGGSGLHRPRDAAARGRAAAVQLHRRVAHRGGDKLDEKQRVDFANASAKWTVSNLLHGEQGALSLSAKPVRHLPRSRAGVRGEPGAEEARHARVRDVREVALRRTDLRVGDTIGNLLRELVATPVV